MAFQATVEHREGYSVVRVEGSPTLGQALSYLEGVAAESTAWKAPRLLFDMRGVSTLTTFAEHYALGQSIGRQLRHLQRIASLVPPDRITRASEKTARQAGVRMAVFTDEAEAVDWLTALANPIP